MRDIIDMAKRPIKKEFEKIDENDVIFITILEEWVMKMAQHLL